MTSSEIRKIFLEFFRARNHVIVPSSSLVPDDPSVLMTTAGMQQFKPYYINAADPFESPHPTLGGNSLGAKNVVSVQKCFRTSDIDCVGDASHLTFFEMLGNFSFGGYFKKEAIVYAFDFITKEMQLSISYVTIFKGSETIPKDDQSLAIWNALGVYDVREQGMEDVFWGPTGASGPCGPTTEIYCKNVNGEDVEIWNLVFNEFFYPGSRDELLSGVSSKKLEKLKIAGVDTGMGLERLSMIAQKALTIFDTDLFNSLRESLIYHVPYVGEREMRSLRIVADHARGATFLLGDGIRPSNVEQGYVLRRVLRRAIRHGSILKLPKGFLAPFVSRVIDLYAEAYPELAAQRNNILTAISDEQVKFERTLGRGLKEFERLINNKVKGASIIGDEVFHLYDTYGFPVELTKELAEERGMSIDEEGFKSAFSLHQERSRAGSVKKFGGHGLMLAGELKASTAEEVKIVTRLHTATHMLHKALRSTLGQHVKQMGSDITPERLRFDFTHPKKLEPGELKELETLINKKISEDLPVSWKETTYQEASREGALAFFKEKYPPMVKVYSIGDWSREICGGPHVDRTSELGHFKITKEESVAAGVRRIRAVVE